MKMKLAFLAFFTFCTFCVNAESVIQGILFSRRSGTVYPDITIELLRNNERFTQTQTDSVGKFSFNVPPGQYRLNIRDEFFRDDTSTGNFLVEENMILVIELDYTARRAGGDGVGKLDYFNQLVRKEAYVESETSKLVVQNFLKSREEAAFMDTLKLLPVILPMHPSSTRFEANDYFKSLFSRNHVVTFLDLKYKIDTLLKYCGWNLELNCYSVSGGFVIVANPHPISENGGKCPGCIQGKNGTTYRKNETWADAFYYMRHERVGYERCIIFAFTNAAFNFGGTGREKETLNPVIYPNNVKDPSTKVNYTRRKVACTVFTYTFKYNDLTDPGQLNFEDYLINKPSAIEHLKIMGIYDHF